jgi:hypothetical protein
MQTHRDNDDTDDISIIYANSQVDGYGGNQWGYEDTNKNSCLSAALLAEVLS